MLPHLAGNAEGLGRPGPQAAEKEEASGALRETRHLEKVTEARPEKKTTSSEEVRSRGDL